MSSDNSTHVNLNDLGWIYSVAQNVKGILTGTIVFILSVAVTVINILSRDCYGYYNLKIQQQCFACYGRIT